MKSVVYTVGARAALAIALVALGAPQAVAAPPTDMQLQGSLATGAGTPVTGQFNLTIGIFTTQVGGTASWTQTFNNVQVTNGVYEVTLPGLDPALFRNQGSLWLETKVNSEAPLPRAKMGPAGWAFHSVSAGTAAVAEDVACTGCVGTADLAAGLRVGGNFTVQQSLILCDGLAGTCSVKLNDTATLASSATTLSVQANSGLRIRNFGDTAWAPLQTGVLTVNGNATVNGNLTVSGTISGTLSALPWSALTGVPAGFADGVDNDTTYTAGTGLTLATGQFSINPAQAQVRVSGTCNTGQAMRVVNADGTVVCGTAGATYTAPVAGGLAINGSNELSLRMSCTSGQVLKYDGSAWACSADATGGVTSFSGLSGTATDAQIPDNITINWALDSDKVDGHHYSPVWDSTDAATLGGQPPSYYATKASVDELAGQVSNPPQVQQAICASSGTTNVCKKDVYMAATHTRDANSLSSLSGGSWVYYAAENRCEYQGGIEVDNPKQCGQDLMPDWMDTSDNCGGFRQSSWDTRVRFAVAKDNVWNKDFNYTCPAGYHWATTEEVKPWFNGPNTGNYVYLSQCGWNSYVWNGKTRYYFRFKDSPSKQNSFKHSGNYDPYTIQYDGTLNYFAGIVCVQDAPMGPLDWMITEDDCGGFKESTWDSNFAFAVARKTVYDPSIPYTCPEGWHWATTAETQDAFVASPNTGYLYYGKCGWNGYDMQSNGLTRYYFRTSDSFTGPTTLAYKHAGNGEMYRLDYNNTKTEFAGIICKRDQPNTDPTDWMDKTDFCGGWRQNTWDPRFYYAIAKKNIWDPNKVYACPAGYHWASTAEVNAAFTAANPDESPNYAYYNQCGWSGYYWQGIQRYYFRFSDSKTTNRYKHAGNWDPYADSTSATLTEFAGIICMKDNAPTYPTPNTTDWMLTDDDCGGFRESMWTSRIRYAVARQNVWNKSFTYKCPAGYHWGSQSEVAGMLTSAINPSYYRYNGQCGWSGYYWHARYRVYFRFSDSAINNGYLHAAHGDPYTFATDASTASFAGIVCVADQASTDPTDWMDKTDNCEGFRESQWDTRVRYAVSKDYYWDQNKVYACPAGYHWMSYAEAQQVFPTTAYNGGATYTYYSQCGWSGYNWHQLSKTYFRFSDSKTNGMYKHAGNYDPYQPQGPDFTTSSFAGIVCMKNDPPGPTDWMDTSDNCGGFRQSLSDPDVFYAVSKSNIWNPNRTYTCPSGYHWATTAEGQARFNNVPAWNTNTYHGQCGWSGYDWNPAWQFGCTSYGQAGCGSTYASPNPTMAQMKTGQFQSGCDECDTWYGTTCYASELTSGAAGKCGGINEAHWRNDQHINPCYFSPNSFGGNPIGVTSGSLGDHCYNGVCCGDSVIQNVSTYRNYFRFSDSKTTGMYKHAGNNDNYNVQGADMTLYYFAGIVCIKD
ncbi:MAG: hypothetical protein AMXMBFR64_16610 [Myxococcales bacterium]